VTTLERFAGSDVLVGDRPTSSTVARSISRAVKRGIDVVGSALGLLLISPLLLVLAVLVVLDSSGPAFYRQTRAGRHGRPFSMVKFRTMHRDAGEKLAALKAAHQLDGPLFKLEDDPRVTRVGRTLRRFSLDELPQLWNVLRGDMSLVGPRPGLPCEVDDYCDKAVRRLEVSPGMTGAWQVGGRSTLGWQEGLDLDLHYVDHWSLAYDIRILVKTAGAVVRPVGAY
jgi:lipopolysaccharide/colanic/teichoic acid biosynthesis glycosyltransferase